MKTNLNLWLIVFLMAVFTSTAQASKLEVGATAPGFSLINQHQATISLADFAGGWVVLYFYPKNDTPGCTTEACSFRDNINALINQQATVIGISVDNAESHAQFAKKYQLPFNLLSDPKAVVATQYGSVLNFGLFKMAKRHSFIINPAGKIVKIYRNVNPDQHVQDVMNDLKALQAEQPLS